jgi:hypothetical protein
LWAFAHSKAVNVGYRANPIPSKLFIKKKVGKTLHPEHKKA